MKKTKLVIILFLIAILPSLAQESSSASPMPKYCYCEVVGAEGGMFSTKVKITIDFGQAVNFFSQNSKREMVDENGTPIKFNSMIDAMNYMARFGWEVDHTYAITHGNNHVYHFLLKKKYVSEEDMLRGIVTRDQYKKMKQSADE
ncbi:TPA_asm: Q-rule protein [Porphyromonas phage phage017a_JCVISC001]|uniref:Q-rule protein n=1 Tax=Porphyromonas phage phage017a_JCVISC001 TaxID=3154107 RepID=A0AAT9JC07_9CAUD